MGVLLKPRRIVMILWKAKDLLPSLGELSKPLLLHLASLFLKGAPIGILYWLIHELLLSPSLPPRALEILSISLFAGAIGYAWLSIKANLQGYLLAYESSAQMRLKLLHHFKKIPLAFFKTKNAGEVSSYLLQDTDKVETILSHRLGDAIAVIFMPLVIWGFLLFFHWKMAFLMLGIVIFGIPLLWQVGRIVQKIGHKHLKACDQSALYALEFIEGIQEIKLNNASLEHLERLDRAMQERRTQALWLEGLGAAPGLLFRFWLDAGYLFSIWCGFYWFSLGEMEMATLLLFIVVGYRFFEPIQNGIVVLAELQYMSLSLSRLKEVFSYPVQEEASTPLVLPDSPCLSFNCVSFAYQELEVLQEISFTLPPKSTTALVGDSGSGKSTIVSLLARFWEVSKGEITLGGNSLIALPFDQLYDQLSIILQEVFLFEGTVAQNIAIAKPNASTKEIIHAALEAECHEFITSLPQGYETNIGEKGARLSGGERQRIAIARAILKDAPIVILDEATASLDAHNELAVRRGIQRLTQNKSVLVIAHRLSTLTSSDQILVMDQGRLIEKGTHQELLNLRGHYAKLWALERQSMEARMR